MVELFGLTSALLSSVLFGLYMAPRKISHMAAFSFTLNMTFGIILVSGVVLLAQGGRFQASAEATRLGLTSGAMWVLGLLWFSLGVRELGLAVATPIKNTTAVLGTVIGIVVFREWTHTQPVLCMVGSLLVAWAAVLVGQMGAEEGQNAIIGSGRLTPLGVIYCLLAALGFAAYTIPLKMAMDRHMALAELIFFLGLGACAMNALLLVALERDVVAWVRQPFREHAVAISGGMIWVTGTFCMTKAIQLIGLAVTWPIANLNSIFAVLTGIVVFREINARRQGRRLVLALFAAVIGTLLLGLSKHPAVLALFRSP